MISIRSLRTVGSPPKSWMEGFGVRSAKCLKIVSKYEIGGSNRNPIEGVLLMQIGQLRLQRLVMSRKTMFGSLC